jgi:serine/threonine protein phosphatase PrpC
MLKSVFASVVNLDPKKKGFDSFSASDTKRLFALCDGANSCLGSGEAAKWLSETLIKVEPQKNETDTYWQTSINDLHKHMLTLYPETASTLAFAHVHEQGLTLGNLGDSYLRVFHHADQIWSRWRLVEELQRDVDSRGHPSQMLGSEVCNDAHLMSFKPTGSYLLLFMSDGVGNFWQAQTLLQRLSIISTKEPSTNDLQYLCSSIAQHALDLGSNDDASVALVWCHFEN